MIFGDKLRARDVEHYLLLESDVHPKVRTLLKELAERQYVLQTQIAGCVSLCQMVVEQAESFNMIAEGMKTKLDVLARNQQDPLGE